jgi:hypothetical protein
MTASRRIAITVRRPPTADRRPPAVTAVLAIIGAAAGGQRVTVLGRNLATKRGNTTISFGMICALRVRCTSHRAAALELPRTPSERSTSRHR